MADLNLAERADLMPAVSEVERQIERLSAYFWLSNVTMYIFCEFSILNLLGLRLAAGHRTHASAAKIIQLLKNNTMR